METICDMLHITLNKNAVFGDASALTPGGCRIGAPAMTSRGLKENDLRRLPTFSTRRLSSRWRCRRATARCSRTGSWASRATQTRYPPRGGGGVRRILPDAGIHPRVRRHLKRRNRAEFFSTKVLLLRT